MVSAPAFTIVVELEAVAPTVRLNALTDGETARLHDWLAAHPDLLDLVIWAMELRDAAYTTYFPTPKGDHDAHD